MIHDFNSKFWRYLKKHSQESIILDYIKTHRATQASVDNKVFEASDFTWLFCLNFLDKKHRAYLNIDNKTSHNIKKIIKQLGDFPSASYIQEQLRSSFFYFLSDSEKNSLVNAITDTFNISLDYKRGKLESIWATQPENWVIKIVQEIQNQNKYDQSYIRHLAWALAKTLNQLGFRCFFSYNSAKAFLIYYDKLTKNNYDLDYTIWIKQLKNLEEEKAYTLDMAGEIFLQDRLVYKKFLDFLTLDSEQYKSSLEIKKFLINRDDNLIKNYELVDFLYNQVFKKNLVEEVHKNNIFEDIENDFIPKSNFKNQEDWIAFWRGVKLFEKRYSKFKNEKNYSAKIILDNPEKVYKWFMVNCSTRYQESLWCIVLDNKNSILNFYEVFRGTVNQTITHPREIFALAIENLASSIILLHNHPSGDPHPSPNDREITERMRKSGDILGIRLLDHIIIGKNSFYSFNDGFSTVNSDDNK